MASASESMALAAQVIGVASRDFIPTVPFSGRCVSVAQVPSTPVSTASCQACVCCSLCCRFPSFFPVEPCIPRLLRLAWLSLAGACVTFCESSSGGVCLKLFWISVWIAFWAGNVATPCHLWSLSGSRESCRHRIPTGSFLQSLMLFAFRSSTGHPVLGQALASTFESVSPKACVWSLKSDVVVDICLACVLCLSAICGGLQFVTCRESCR